MNNLVNGEAISMLSEVEEEQDEPFKKLYIL